MCFQEIKHLCSDNYDSILSTTSDVAMTHFSWESIWIEISTKAPTLVSILKSCLPVKTKLNPKPVLCLCVSMLLKLRNRKMCHVQSAISLIVHAGHAGSMVSLFHLYY